MLSYHPFVLNMHQIFAAIIHLHQMCTWKFWHKTDLHQTRSWRHVFILIEQSSSFHEHISSNVLDPLVSIAWTGQCVSHKSAFGQQFSVHSRHIWMIVPKKYDHIWCRCIIVTYHTMQRWSLYWYRRCPTGKIHPLTNMFGTNLSLSQFFGTFCTTGWLLWPKPKSVRASWLGKLSWATI